MQSVAEIVLFCIVAAALAASVLNAKELTHAARFRYWRVIYVMLCFAVATDLVVHSFGSPELRAPGWAGFILGIGILPMGIHFHRLSMIEARREEEQRELTLLLHSPGRVSSEELTLPVCAKSDLLRGVGTMCWLFGLAVIPVGFVLGIANPVLASAVP